MPDAPFDVRADAVGQVRQLVHETDRVASIALAAYLVSSAERTVHVHDLVVVAREGRQ